MIDPNKYPDLAKEMENTLKMREEWLNDISTACELFDFIPDEIKSDVTSMDYSHINETLKISLQCKNNTFNTLKLLGVQGLKPIVSQWQKESFYANGEFVLSNGIKCDVFATNIPKPTNCRIEEKIITRTEKVLVCERTNEPL